MNTDKVVSLQGNKRKVKGKSLTEYSRGRRLNKQAAVALAKSKGLVTETTWELMVGKSMAGNKQNR